MYDLKFYLMVKMAFTTVSASRKNTIAADFLMIRERANATIPTPHASCYIGTLRTDKSYKVKGMQQTQHEHIEDPHPFDQQINLIVV
jgi:hypothetical protein